MYMTKMALKFMSFKVLATLLMTFVIVAHAEISVKQQNNLLYNIRQIHDPKYTGIKTRTYQRDPLIAQAFDEQQHQQQYDDTYNPHYHGYNANVGLSALQPQGSYNTNGRIQDQSHSHSQVQPIYERPSSNDNNNNNNNWHDAENAVTEYFTGCPSQHTGPLPYAYDCRRFLNCFKGRGHIQSCGPGTVFNPETLECDRPDKVICGANIALGEQTQNKPSRSGRLLNLEPHCPPGVTGLHPHPTDCTKFLNCANGQTYVQNCGPGTAYSASMMACDFKDKVDCGEREYGVADITPAYANSVSQKNKHSDTLRCPTGITGLYPHPHDRRKYLNCRRQDAWHSASIEECNQDQIFDNVKLVCVFSAYVSSNAFFQQNSQSLVSSTHQHDADLLCPTGRLGLFVHPFDNTKFFNCKDGKIAIQSCIENHVFSISKGYCVQKDDLVYTDYVQYIVSEVSYEYSLMLTSCPPGTDGNHLYPYDGHKYLKCHNGQMSIVSCGQDLGYSISKKLCRPLKMLGESDRVKFSWELERQTVIKHDSSYGDTQVFQSTLTQCPRDTNGLYPYSFHGTKYILCQNGLLQIETCTSGKVFSLSKKQCLLRTQVEASDFIWLETTAINVDYEYLVDLTTITCPPNSNGYFLHPFDCTKYLICRDQQTIIENCSNGSVFSISKRKCVKTDQVEAYDRVEYLTNAQQEFFDESRHKPGIVGSSVVGDNWHTNSEHHLNKNDANDNEIVCPVDANGLQPHPNDCTKFLNCANGQTFIQSCGPDTTWSIELEVCDLLEKVNCANRPTKHPNRSGYEAKHGQEISCPSTVYGLYAHPFDNTKFIRCEGGYSNVQKCCQANVFSISRSYCLPQSQVPANDRVNYLGANRHSTTEISFELEFIACPKDFMGAYLYPFDCTKYISCSNGLTELKSCAEGTHYSISHGACLSEIQVEHTDRVYSLKEIQKYNDWIQNYGRDRQSTSIRCPVGMIGLYHHPFDPTKFLSCRPEEVSIYDCPPNTLFSVSRRLCIAQEEVSENDRCNFKAQSRVTKQYQYGYATNTNVNHSTGEATCPPSSNGMQPHPYDCTKFLNCANGVTHVQSCPPETAWQIHLEVCDFIDKVDCSGRQREGRSFEENHNKQILCSPEASGLQAHPHDCKKYLNCANGRTFVQECGPGTAWNIALEVCDFIAKVDCSGREGSNVASNNFNREPNAFSPSGTAEGHLNHWGYDKGYNKQTDTYTTTATTTDQSIHTDRWSNMNMQRPAGVGFNQHTTRTNTQHTAQPTWSGYGTSQDHLSPTQDTLYVEGSLAPNRNYQQMYHTPLAPFTPQGTVTDDKFSITTTNKTTTAINNFVYPQPDTVYAQRVDSQEEDSLQDSINSWQSPTQRQNYSREINPGSAPNHWRQILQSTPYDDPSTKHHPQSAFKPHPSIPTTQLMPPYNNNVDLGQKTLNEPYDSTRRITHINVDNLPNDRRPFVLSEHDQLSSGSEPSGRGTLPDASNLYGGLQPPEKQGQSQYDQKYTPDSTNSNQSNVPNPYSNHKPTYVEPTYVYRTPTSNVDSSNLYGGLQPPPLASSITTTPATYTTPNRVLQPPNKPTEPSSVRLFPIMPSVLNATASKNPSYPHYSPSYSGVSHSHNATWMGKKLPPPQPRQDTQEPFHEDDYDTQYKQDADGIDRVNTKHLGNRPPNNIPYPYNNEFYSTPKTPISQDISQLPISEALRMLLKPYFNRSGTIDDSTAIKAESHIMSLVNEPSSPTTMTTTATPTTTATVKSQTSVDDFELIIAGEQENLMTTVTVPKTHYNDSTTNFNLNHGNTGSTNWHTHGHSRDFHARHPNLPSPFIDNESQTHHNHHSDHTHHDHSRAYHNRHPELPNPFTVNEAKRHHGHQHSREFHQRHPELPNPFNKKENDEPISHRAQDSSESDELPFNPRAESTTPKSSPKFNNRRINLRGAFDGETEPCEFDCGNGKCVKKFEVCDGVSNCSNRKDEIQCEHLGYEVRLTGGESPNMGRIEIKILGKWGYVCDDKFGLRDADVACKELGFKLGASEVRGNSYYPPTDVNFSYAMDEVECHGNETKLKDCQFKGWGVNNCGPDEVVGVICKVPLLKCPDNYWLCSTSKECIPPAFVCDNTEDCADKSDESPAVCNSPVEYRLEGGRSASEGRLEVKYRGEWGTICDDDFSLKEAQVACNSLGYFGQPKIEKNIFGLGNGPIWLDQVSCIGNETTLDKCNHWTWGEHNCNHTEDVGLRCTAGPPPRRTTALHKVADADNDDIDDAEDSQDQQTVLENIGLYSRQWERSSKSLNNQRRCGHFKDDIEDEYAHPEERVVNGSIAKRGRYPWQATIRTRGRGGISSHWCGAVLISKRHLLTAAHCLAGYPKGAYFVRMGDHYATIAESSEVDSFIENWYIHEKFRDESHMNNDIALVVLKTSVRFNDYVQPICLPEKGKELSENRICTISGWGSIKSGVSTPSNILRAAQLPILPEDTCKQPHVYGTAITEGMFCAGSMDESVDACDGDSGGPLVCSDDDGETLYGIISWGQHCGYINKPGVYVKVGKYVDWIYEKINFSIQRKLQ